MTEPEKGSWWRGDCRYIICGIVIVAMLVTLTFIIITQEREINGPGSQAALTAQIAQERELIENQNIRISELEKRLDEQQYPRIDYYAYGDSITAQPNNYLMQMIKNHTPGKVALFNTDGSGQTSQWGVQNIASHLRKNTSIMFYMFVNDETAGYPIDVTIENYLKIYDYAESHGTKAIPMIPTQRSWTSPRNRSIALQDALEARGIIYVPMYDSIDAHPNNGIIDDYEPTLMFDGVHPDPEGHRRMGEYLWQFLQKSNISA